MSEFVHSLGPQAGSPPGLLPTLPLTPIPGTPPLPFALWIPDESRTKGPRSALCRQHDVRGIARLEGGELVIEWSGITQVQEVDGHAAEVRREPFPAGRRVIPLTALGSIRRRGWWWRPRVELRVAELALLEGVPGAQGPLLRLGIARGDLALAGALVVAARSVAKALGGPTAV